MEFGGDENSYFHTICSARQRRSFISNIVSESGLICTKDEDIEKTFIEHFNNIYSATEKEQYFVKNIHWAPILTSTKNLIDFPFDEIVILNSLKSFDNNKVLSPNGYTMEFMKKNWKIMKNEILNIFKRKG